MNSAPATQRYDDEADDLDRQLLTGTAPNEAFGRTPTTPALSAEPLVDCPDCHGEGEIRFNPSRSVPKDPQLEDSARCGRCHGDGTLPAAGRDDEQCIVCGAAPNIRCCEFARDH